MKSTYTWNIPCMYMVYTGYIQCRFWYTIYIQWIYMVYTAWYIPSIYQVYTLCIQCIYQVYTFDNISICNVYTLHIHCICGESERPWVKISVDLGLCCHRVTLQLTINLYHDTWLMSDWSSVWCLKHSNLRNQSTDEMNRNKILNFSELIS